MKSLVYNGRFSVGGLITQAVSQDQNETLSFKKKEKEKKRTKQKVSPVDSESKSLPLKNCHSQSSHLCVELCVLRFACMDEFLELPTSHQ